MNHRQEIALRIRDYQLRSVAHGGDSARDFRFQCFKTRAVARGDQNRIRGLDDGIRLYAVGLVKHLENRAVGGAEVVQNLEYRIALLGVIRAGQVGTRRSGDRRKLLLPAWSGMPEPADAAAFG